jgi:hypothetical protein
MFAIGSILPFRSIQAGCNTSSFVSLSGKPKAGDMPNESIDPVEIPNLFKNNRINECHRG